MCGQGQEDLGEYVKDDRKLLGLQLSGQCSEICGET